MNLTVKICGVRTVHHARIAAEAGADFVGLVFAPSRRQVTSAEAREITSATYTRRPRFVGVFVNADPDEVACVAGAARLDLAQLSGSESPEECARLRVPYIKVAHVRVGMTADDVLHIIDQYPDAVGFVLDAMGGAQLLYKGGGSEGEGDSPWGGTGATIDWSLAAEVARRADKPVTLAGGLRPETVSEAVRIGRPWGVDVSSGVETGGVKDDEKIRAFIDAVKGVVLA